MSDLKARNNRFVAPRIVSAIALAVPAAPSLLLTTSTALATCTINSTTMDCFGDESSGIVVRRDDHKPPIQTLNVDNLTRTIGGTGVELEGNGKKGDNGDGDIGRGHHGQPGQGGLDLTINYRDDRFGVETTSAGHEGIFVSSKAGNGGEGGEGRRDLIDPFFTRGGHGGEGGRGGNVAINSVATISTGGTFSHGILAVSDGGDGGRGGHAQASADSRGGDGGAGGRAGTVTIVSTGESIKTTGRQAQGIYAQSLGGAGGDGGSSSGGIWGGGGGGAGGGIADEVTVTNSSAIETTGRGAGGILAQSIGGFAGSGGGAGGLFSFGASEQSGGDADRVTVTNHATITTQGHAAAAILAQSTGGGGGSANDDGGIISLGGKGSAGGDAGHVWVTNTETLYTQGNNSAGIQAQSVGGGGGDAGLSIGLVSIGGSGGSGGKGGEVTVENSGGVSTIGRHSDAIIAQSIGGGGGHGGSSGGVIASVGGSGGSGGDGSTVVVDNSGDLSTKGSHSNGIMAQSVGGGGGKGGSSVDVGAFVSIGIGGSGGDGGDGGKVEVNKDVGASSASTSVTTAGNHASGVVGQSVGGGGGKGGWTVSVSGGLYGDVSLGIGGSGADGGDGNDVTVHNKGTVGTSGKFSDGVVAQSTGGGGGLGGFDVTAALSTGAGLSVGVGGGGGGGGDSGAVELSSWTSVSTSGNHSNGLVAQSVGGGGGHGGFSADLSASADASIGIGVGGSGGSGGDAGESSLTSEGHISTEGNHANAVLAQSVGGGGGNGGFSATLAVSESFNVSVSVGGRGGSGGDASAVTATSKGSLTTKGSHASGVVAQSIGGGGGNGGFSLSLSGSGEGGDIPVSVGGGAGSGGKAKSVTVSNDGNISTEGDHSYGILAQSLAGGGGNGGFSISGSLAIGDGAEIPVSVGGGGGDGHSASAVKVDSIGNIKTGTADKGRHSAGILAQSIGGGGGNAGFSVSAGVVTGEDGGNIGVSVGGKGGTGSKGGTVDVTSKGDISTILGGSPGIQAQSVGGGGGNGGFSANFDGSQYGNIGVSVGGAGGSGNDGSKVTVDNTGKIVTTGKQSYGISAQSIGGGGGHGGFSLSGSFSKATNVTVAVGGSGGGGGDGGKVEVKQSGSISTEGNSSHAVLAQSVGNSGGAGGFAGDANIAIEEGGNIGVAVGGGGGDGGSAESVTVETEGGDILTKGRGAIGILAQSTGGSGGSGGFGLTANLGTGKKTVNIAVTVGGGGGDGGTSGDVSVTNASSVKTEHSNAHAVHAQSTGGSGGNGGMAISANLALNPKSPSQNLGVSVGGGGGTGNVSGKVVIDNDGGIHTKGFKSKGLFAQSIGGGGGDGGLAFSGNLAGGQDSKEINVSVGGKGGTGNNADTVTVINDGTILTEGHFSEGILAHSVGGGGGSGGTAAVAALSRQGQGTSIDIGVAIGGSGGAAGDGKAVDVTNNGTIMTTGVSSTAIDAQSIGGGGGKGGSSFAGIAGLTQGGDEPKPRTVNVNVSVGGQGGSGGDASTVMVTNTGRLYTGDGSSKGISAQSVGGGGGTGGAADAFSLLVGRCAVCGQKAPDNGAKKISLSVSIGGAGGGAGNGDDVTVDNIGEIVTEGAGSDGIFAQSIGGGGGDGGTGALGLKPLLGLTGVIIADGNIILDPAKAAKVWTNIQVAIGGSGGAGGNSGKVKVDNSGLITTLGDQSTAIYAQSVGGGGGRGGASSGSAFAIASIGAKGASGGDAETVTVKNEGDIFTLGRASMGIFAQSVGGGGGHGGDVSQNLFWPGIDVGIGIDLSLGGGSGGNGGNVKVDNSGKIVTEGAGAHGIFAQSVGGGGGVAGSAGLSPGSALFFIGSTGDDGDAGRVDVTTEGDIYTFGDGAAGIFAQSGSGRKKSGNHDYANGATGTGKEVTVTVDAMVDTAGINSKGVIAQSIGVNKNSDITVTVEAGGAVIGGVDTDGKGNASDAVGIQLYDGKDNQITNMGLVTTQLGYMGTAIASRTTRANETTVNDTVDNYDTVTGSIFLRGETNSVTNFLGGRLNMGSDINVGDGNLVTNFGTVSPGDVDQIFVTTITGNYVQNGTGNYEVDVDFKIADENPGPGVPGEADLIHITGTAELDGFVTVNPVNGAYLQPDVSGRVLILTADDEYGDPTLVAHDTAVVDYELSYDTTTTNNVYLGWTVNFAPDGLNRNETNAADYITDVVGAGAPDALTPIINALLEAPDIPTLRNYYDQLTPEAYIDNELATVLGNMRFGRSLMNCHTVDEAGRCGWIRFGGYRTERDETFEYFGFTENVLDGEAGVGGMINDNTGLYFGLNYARSDIDTEDLASSDGHRIQGGLGFSHYGDSGTIFSMAALGGAAWYDVERYLTLTGTPMTAEGDQKIYFGGGQVKLSHEATNGPFSITPSVEAWGGYFYNSAITETGAAGASLNVDGEGDFFAAVRPALKIATENKTAGGGTISAFVQGGITYIAYGNQNFGTGFTATMQGDANAVPGFLVTSTLADWYFDSTVGLNWTSPGGTQFRLSGGAQFADDYTIYGGDAELVVPF